MKVLFDINVILDVLLNRTPFVDLSANLVSLVENNKIDGYLCATTITTIDYLIAKDYKPAQLPVYTPEELWGGLFRLVGLGTKNPPNKECVDGLVMGFTAFYPPYQLLFQI